jgi:hypothetical protein
MKIIAFKKYGHGFVGMADQDDGYVYFTFSNGKLKRLHEYAKKDFESYHHFVSTFGRLMGCSFFLPIAMDIDVIDRESLERLHVRIKS